MIQNDEMEEQRSKIVSKTLDVLFEDESLIVVNKPSGLLVHRGWANDSVTALSLARKAAQKKVYPVHRLDRGTSGALVFAKSSEMAARLQSSFQDKSLKKSYVALVRGILAEPCMVDKALAPDKEKAKKDAQTEFEPLGTFERYGLVLAKPLTGRTHQIRRHLKHLSMPIIGDVRYGKGEHNRIFRERFTLQRLALHALSLCFSHPENNSECRIYAPVPDDLLGPLRCMDLASAIPGAYPVRPTST